MTSPAKGQHWTEVDTPRLLVDLDQVQSNIRTFHDRVAAGGALLRSHIKTHKTPRIARLQLDMGATGIATAKTSEAEVFVDHGFRDVVIAYPVFGRQKWERMAALADRCRLTAHVENPEAVRGLSAAATKAGTTVQIRVEIDTGFHRTGVNAEAATELARLVRKLPGLEFDGITSHRSIFFPDADDAPPDTLGHDEGRLMVAIADGIRDAGLEVRSVVAGSTPTGPPLADVEGVTEVCAGTYVFYDAGMADLGINAHHDIALSVSATVVASPLTDRYTIDGGAKTFSKDTYPGTEPGVLGRSADRRGDTIVGLTDEHGIVASDQPADLGAVHRFFPMHVCPMVNLADELVMIRDEHVVDVWPVRARGKNR